MASSQNNLNLKSAPKSAKSQLETSAAKTAVQARNFQWPGDDRGDQLLDKPQLSKSCLVPVDAIKKFDLQESGNRVDKDIVEDISKLKQSLIDQSESPDITCPSTPRTDARNNLLEMSGHKVTVLQPVPPRKVPRPPSVPKSGRNTPQRWGRKLRSPALPPIVKGVSIADASVDKDVGTYKSPSPPPAKPPTPPPAIEVESVSSEQNKSRKYPINRKSTFPIVYSPSFLPPLKEERQHILRMFAQGKKVTRMDRNIQLDPSTNQDLQPPKIVTSQYMTKTSTKKCQPSLSAPASMATNDKESKHHQPELDLLKIDTRPTNDTSTTSALIKPSVCVRRCSSLDNNSRQEHGRKLEKLPHAQLNLPSVSELELNLSTKRLLPPILNKSSDSNIGQINNPPEIENEEEREEHVDFLSLSKKCLPQIQAVTEAKVREKVQKFRDITEESLQRMMDRLDFDCFFDTEWSFPEDSNLHRAVLLRNHALNHGIIYRLNKQKTEMARDIESMESFQQLGRRPSQVMTLEHLENGEIKTNNRVLIFDQNKGKTFVHASEREVKLGDSILSAINNCKAKKLKKVSDKKSAQKSKASPSKSVSQQCHIGPPNGFVNIPIRIQNLPPIKVTGLGPSNIVHSLAATKLTTVPTVTQLSPQTKQPRLKTTNKETTTIEKFNQSIHGKKLCGTKKRGSQKACNNKRTE